MNIIFFCKKKNELGDENLLFDMFLLSCLITTPKYY